MVTKGRSASFDPDAFLAALSRGRTTVRHQAGQLIFGQGDVADAVFYVAHGKIKLFVVSEQGIEKRSSRCLAKGISLAKGA
jgi:CRP/FNR family cyclic AMP-dependent transcriptional regulator